MENTSENARKEELLKLAEERGIEIGFMEIDKDESFTEKVYLCGDGETFYLASIALDYDKSAEELLDALRSSHKEPDIEGLLSLENLHVCLMNVEGNEHLLKKIPHRELCDLAVYYRFIKPCCDGCLSAIVTNSLVNMKGWSEEQLYNLALSNNHMVYYSLLRDFPFFSFENSLPFFNIISNTYHCFGAGELLSFIDTTDKNFYAFVDNVHDSIVLEADESNPSKEQIESFSEMLEGVSDFSIESHQFLSKNIYFYDNSQKKFFVYRNTQK